MSDPTKQLIYESYVTLLHLNEQRQEADLQEFFKLATGEIYSLLPRNMTSIHVIDCIGHNEPINNSTIAKKMNLSKANITKISTKLLQEGLIKRFQLTDNKKEVYFRLTSKGKQVFDMHNSIHVKKRQQFYQFLANFSAVEQDAILKFLNHLTLQISEERAD